MRQNVLTGITTTFMEILFWELLEILKELYYHRFYKILKVKYFGLVQLRTPEIPEYIPCFLYYVDGVANNKFEFLRSRKFRNKSSHVNMYWFYMVTEALNPKILSTAKLCAFENMEAQ
jgi:hypothetical protein